MEPESDRESCDEVGGVPANSSYKNAEEEEDKNLSGSSHTQKKMIHLQGWFDDRKP